MARGYHVSFSWLLDGSGGSCAMTRRTEIAVHHSLLAIKRWARGASPRSRGGCLGWCVSVAWPPFGGGPPRGPVPGGPAGAGRSWRGRPRLCSGCGPCVGLALRSRPPARDCIGGVVRGRARIVQMPSAGDRQQRPRSARLSPVGLSARGSERSPLVAAAASPLKTLPWWSLTARE